MKHTDEWVPVAEIARSHGVRGEVRLRPFNKDSDVLLQVDEVLVRLPDGEEHEVSVDRARPADGAVLMKLHSVDDKDRADELRASTVLVRRGDFAPLAEGEFYVCDVVGAKVVHGGTEVGELVDLRSYPSVDVLVVRASPVDGAKAGFAMDVQRFDSTIQAEASIRPNRGRFSNIQSGIGAINELLSAVQTAELGGGSTGKGRMSISSAPRQTASCWMCLRAPRSTLTMLRVRP